MLTRLELTEIIKVTFIARLVLMRSSPQISIYDLQEFHLTETHRIVSCYAATRNNNNNNGNNKNIELLVMTDFCMVNHHTPFVGNHRTEESLAIDEAATPSYRSAALDHVGWRGTCLCYETSTLTKFCGEDQRGQEVIQTEMC